MTSTASPSSPLATHPPTAGSFVVDRWRLNKISAAISEPPKTLTVARETLDELKKQLAEISTNCARADNLASANTSLAAIKQRAITARPKNLEDARLIFAEIATAIDGAAQATPQVAIPSGAKSAPTATSPGPKIDLPAPAPTDAALLAAYVQLEGAERREFFALHGGAIWRAHERAVRSPRGR